MLAQKAPAVGKLHLLALERANTRLRIQQRDGSDHVFDLAAVGACVHAHRAAQRAGDPVGKFKTAQPFSPRIFRDPCKRCPALRRDFICLSAVGNARHPVAHINDQTIEPLVWHEEIRTVADHQRPRTARERKVHQQNELFGIFRKRHALCRAPDAKRNMLRHRLVFDIFEIGQIVRYLTVKRLKPRHSDNSLFFLI